MTANNPSAEAPLLRSARLFVVLTVLAALGAVVGGPGPRGLDAGLAVLTAVLAAVGYALVGNLRRSGGR